MGLRGGQLTNLKNLFMLENWGITGITMTDEIKEIKYEFCKRCKCHRLPESFLNAKQRKLKTCQVCRDRVKASQVKNKDRYTCDQCNYKTCQHGNLARHIKGIHDKIKDHACTQCEYKCSQKRDMARHVKGVHDKIKDIHCDQCDYKCSLKGTMKTYMATCNGTSCLSKGEQKIREILEDMEVKYYYDCSHSPMTDEIGRCLRFDFQIMENKELKAVIEFDGRMHTQDVFNKPAHFERHQQCDEMKNMFCADKSIPMLRIPYTEYGNIPDLVVKFICKHTNWRG